MTKNFQRGIFDAAASGASFRVVHGISPQVVLSSGKKLSLGTDKGALELVDELLSGNSIKEFYGTQAQLDVLKTNFGRVKPIQAQGLLRLAIDETQVKVQDGVDLGNAFKKAIVKDGDKEFLVDMNTAGAKTIREGVLSGQMQIVGFKNPVRIKKEGSEAIANASDLKAANSWLESVYGKRLGSELPSVFISTHTGPNIKLMIRHQVTNTNNEAVFIDRVHTVALDSNGRLSEESLKRMDATIERLTQNGAELHEISYPKNVESNIVLRTQIAKKFEPLATAYRLGRIERIRQLTKLREADEAARAAVDVPEGQIPTPEVAPPVPVTRPVRTVPEPEDIEWTPVGDTPVPPSALDVEETIATKAALEEVAPPRTLAEEVPEEFVEGTIRPARENYQIIDEPFRTDEPNILTDIPVSASGKPIEYNELFASRISKISSRLGGIPEEQVRQVTILARSAPHLIREQDGPILEELLKTAQDYVTMISRHFGSSGESGKTGKLSVVEGRRSNPGIAARQRIRTSLDDAVRNRKMGLDNYILIMKTLDELPDDILMRMNIHPGVNPLTVRETATNGLQIFLTDQASKVSPIRISRKGKTYLLDKVEVLNKELPLDERRVIFQYEDASGKPVVFETTMRTAEKDGLESIDLRGDYTDRYGIMSTKSYEAFDDLNKIIHSADIIVGVDASAHTVLHEISHVIIGSLDPGQVRELTDDLGRVFNKYLEELFTKAGISAQEITDENVKGLWRNLAKEHGTMLRLAQQIQKMQTLGIGSPAELLTDIVAATLYRGIRNTGRLAIDALREGEGTPALRELVQFIQGAVNSADNVFSFSPVVRDEIKTIQTKVALILQNRFDEATQNILIKRFQEAEKLKTYSQSNLFEPHRQIDIVVSKNIEARLEAHGLTVFTKDSAEELLRLLTQEKLVSSFQRDLLELANKHAFGIQSVTRNPKSRALIVSFESENALQNFRETVWPEFFRRELETLLDTKDLDALARAKKEIKEFSKVFEGTRLKIDMGSIEWSPFYERVLTNSRNLGSFDAASPRVKLIIDPKNDWLREAIFGSNSVEKRIGREIISDQSRRTTEFSRRHTQFMRALGFDERDARELAPQMHLSSDGIHSLRHSELANNRLNAYLSTLEAEHGTRVKVSDMLHNFDGATQRPEVFGATVRALLSDSTPLEGKHIVISITGDTFTGRSGKEVPKTTWRIFYQKPDGGYSAAHLPASYVMGDANGTLLSKSLNNIELIEVQSSIEAFHLMSEMRKKGGKVGRLLLHDDNADGVMWYLSNTGRDVDEISDIVLKTNRLLEPVSEASEHGIIPKEVMDYLDMGFTLKGVSGKLGEGELQFKGIARALDAAINANINLPRGVELASGREVETALRISKEYGWIGKLSSEGLELQHISGKHRMIVSNMAELRDAIGVSKAEPDLVLTPEQSLMLQPFVTKIQGAIDAHGRPMTVFDGPADVYGQQIREMFQNIDPADEKKWKAAGDRLLSMFDGGLAPFYYLSDRMQTRTGLPIWDIWNRCSYAYKAMQDESLTLIEGVRDSLRGLSLSEDRFITHLLRHGYLEEGLSESAAANLSMFTTRYSSMMTPRVKKVAAEIKKWYKERWVDVAGSLDESEVPFIQAYAPFAPGAHEKLARGVFTDFAVNKNYATRNPWYMHPRLKTQEGWLDKFDPLSDDRISHLVGQYAFATARQRHLKEPILEARRMMDTIEREWEMAAGRSVNNSRNIDLYVSKRLLSNIVNNATGTDGPVTKAVYGGIYEMTRVLTGSNTAAQWMVDHLLQYGYFTAIGGRIGTALRNFIYAPFPVFATVGGKHLLEGVLAWRAAAKGGHEWMEYASRAHQDFMPLFKRSDEAFSALVPKKIAALEGSEKGLQIAENVMNLSMIPLQRSEVAVRMISFFSGVSSGKDIVAAFKAHKNIPRLLDETPLQVLVPSEQKLLARLLLEGKEKEFISTYATRVVNFTQASYGPIESFMGANTKGGKLAFYFGNWAMHNLSMLRRIAKASLTRNGEFGHLSPNGAKFLMRYTLGVGAGVGVYSALGISPGSTFTYGPSGWVGSPMLAIGGDAWEVLRAGGSGRALAMNKLGTSLTRYLTPAGSALDDYRKGIADIAEKDWSAGLTHIVFGTAPSKELKQSKETGKSRHQSSFTHLKKTTHAALDPILPDSEPPKKRKKH